MKVLDKSGFTAKIASSNSAGIFTCLQGGNSTLQHCSSYFTKVENCYNVINILLNSMALLPEETTKAV
jgi:hypothetical protein